MCVWCQYWYSKYICSKCICYMILVLNAIGYVLTYIICGIISYSLDYIPAVPCISLWNPNNMFIMYIFIWYMFTYSYSYVLFLYS